ncbi:MAG: DUF202 domain-containing protein [Cyclobacteriaceae bacterium]
MNKEEIILRDYLALERTRLANERTLFAYIRTSLYLFLGGFTLLQVDGLGNLGWIGTLSLVFSLIILLIGALRYQQLRKRLKSYYLKRDSELK